MVHTVLIEVSDETLAAMRRDPGEFASELRVAAAAKLYELGQVSQGVAAEIAGLNRAEFLLALSRYQVTPFQDIRESLENELERG
jgi:predicted HTH domain antitoxin